ncbi:chromosome transmission fidelity protein 18 homolog [Styela clava]
MDFDPYFEFQQEDAFEDQYADELDVLNEMEGLPQEATSSSNLNVIKERPDGHRRQLFDDSGPSIPSSSGKHDLSFDHLNNDLLIDEEMYSKSPDHKRARMDIDIDDNYNYYNKKKHNLPTTLDEDKDVMLLRKEIQKENSGASSPAMIDKILRYREKRHQDAQEFIHQGSEKNSSSEKLQLRKVLQYPPVHSEFMSATSSDGQRCYMRIRSDEKLKKEAISNCTLIGNKSLLPESISEMRQMIQVMKEKKILSESHRLTEEIRRQNLLTTTSDVVVHNTDEIMEDSEQTTNIIQRKQIVRSEEDIDEGIYSEDESQKNDLWLDKFAPTQYTHLLSEENVNRTLLKWLKLWDHVVFGHEIQQKEKKQELDMNNQNNKKSYFQIKKEMEERLDEYNRPFFKAALLFGPPGLGKTTLAHIIAKHAGYHVVEMNASDDRSAELFKTKLEQTTQMRSVLGNDERPNCLIIDEIDGAPLAAINVLLTAMSRTRKKEQIKGSKKKAGRNEILMRPVICICNDLYVPALRQLRQQSFVLNFPPTQSARLASRLSQLCRIQRLHCDMTTLLRLCEKADNDIRSCINTLQFAKTSGQNKLSVDTVKGLEIGQKDQHKNIFKVWQDIFQLPKNKRKLEKDAEAAQLSSDIAGKKSSILSTRLYTIHHLVSANGDYEKTFQGVHEHYLKMKFKDHDMMCINKAQEWTQFYDHLLKINLQLQEWSVMRYYPYLFVLFHMMFACVNVPRLGFPSVSFENTKRKQKCENLLESMFVEMVPYARCFTTAQTAILDSIPYILAIMTPTIRPVNQQLFSPAEKKLLKDLVSTMLSYNLSYRQERNEDGQYNYVLEPNVAEICEFEGCQEKRKLPYSTRQMIAKEVEMEKMRRSEHMMEGLTLSQTEQKSDLSNEDKTSSSKKESDEVPSKSTKTPNHLQSLENSIMKASLPKEKPVMDFFSRFKKVKKVRTNEDKPREPAIRDPGIGNSQIWYKFNEGFSNAVRQTVYIKDFL